VTFLTTLALLATVLVIAPYIAHRLRRRTAQEQPFPPTRLVQPAPPTARRRSRLEDRALFATRAAAVSLLALLGATPLVRCSRLALQRSGGASVAMAIVLDDSMSMRARTGGASSRFERARKGARELLASAQEGDAVAVVLAGEPPRVALAATTDLAVARNTVETIAESDRATDLDGALVLAGDLLSSLPQTDRRIVMLSDLADGRPDAPPLGDTSGTPVWNALPELAAPAPDCAVMRADRGGARVRVKIACGPGATAAGRTVVIEDARGNALGSGSTQAGSIADVAVLLPSEHVVATRARLSGSDAVASDDVTPVVTEVGRAAIAVVADTEEESVVTGGAPIAEQALWALKLDVDIHPIPAFPDRAEDLAGTLGVLLDDPPGFTPEQRRALAAYCGGGGVVLIALGPHAAAAPLGASLEPILGRPVAWSEAGRATGADPASAMGELAESAGGLLDLGASHRAVIAPDDLGALEPFLRWTDGAPMVARRRVGRGVAWIVTLPVSIDASDMALRPGFLALLGAWARDAGQGAVALRGEVGASWTFAGARNVDVQGPSGPVSTTRGEEGLRFVPPLIGSYHIVVDGQVETRVASPVVRELDLRPRRAASKTVGAGIGERRASVDMSGYVAFGLLALMAFEMALRLSSRPKEV
jgi:hypothetical protein